MSDSDAVSVVEGVRVGHWTDRDAGTGCTVIIPPTGTVGAVDVRGGGASTRETTLLDPLSNVLGPTAVLFTGGSALGLDASAGVTRWCVDEGIGHDVVVARVPIVVAAVVFDLGVSGGTAIPGPDQAYAACQAAGALDPGQNGSIGAGTGTTVGKYFGRDGWCKGGLGVASTTTHEGCVVSAVVVVNAFGDVLDEHGAVLAGAWHPDQGFVNTRQYSLEHPPTHPRLSTPAHTTLACVITDAALDSVGTAQLARAGTAGMCATIAPVNTPLDGDVTYALATGARPGTALACGIAAGIVVPQAIRAAVRGAVSVRGVPTAAERRDGNR